MGPAAEAGGPEPRGRVGGLSRPVAQSLRPLLGRTAGRRGDPAVGVEQGRGRRSTATARCGSESRDGRARLAGRCNLAGHDEAVVCRRSGRFCGGQGQGVRSALGAAGHLDLRRSGAAGADAAGPLGVDDIATGRHGQRRKHAAHDPLHPGAGTSPAGVGDPAAGSLETRAAGPVGLSPEPQIVVRSGDSCTSRPRCPATACCRG